MSDRPSRAELLLKFFPEIQENAGADTEAAIAMNVRACEAVLADLIDLYDEGLASKGRGMLTLRLFKGAQHSGYLTLEDIEQDLEGALAFGDPDAVSFFRGAIDTIRTHNTDQAALISLADNSRCQVITVSREYPAASIQSMLQEVRR